MTPLSCPLCAQPLPVTPRLTGRDGRRFFHCPVCDLLSADPASHLSAEAEQAFYGTHENVADAGYVRFLQRLLQPALPYLAPGQRALDWGCGPGPVLSELVRAEGLSCDNFDPYFAPVPPVGPYDVIFASECFEHFHQPAQELDRLHALLRPGGLLAVMTERWDSAATLDNWYYLRDPTHVVCFHSRSFDYVARRWGFRPIWPADPRVVLLQVTG